MLATSSDIMRVARHHHRQRGAAGTLSASHKSGLLGADFVYRRCRDYDAIDRPARRAFGVKSVFVRSVAGSSTGSALCGSTTSLTEPVIDRGLQEVCGARMVSPSGGRFPPF